MILKDIDEKRAANAFQEAGNAAEKQMAFYLKRAFQNDKNIRVINDLRLTHNDDAAQIDHLIVHSYGFIIIESKSVTSEVYINSHGEWARVYNGKQSGMPSPINQAQRQADFLKNYLKGQESNLLLNRKFFKASFDEFKYDILIAISDSGIIRRSLKAELDNVKKADQIADAAKAIFDTYSRETNAVFSLKMHSHFADESLRKVSSFLKNSHSPLNASKKEKSVPDQPETPATSVTLPNEQHWCEKCKSRNIEIKYGRYGYYFQCRQCTASTSIKLTCNDKKCKPRIRKQGLKFFKECSNCETSELYFENKG